MILNYNYQFKQKFQEPWPNSLFPIQIFKQFLYVYLGN